MVSYKMEGSLNCRSVKMTYNRFMWIQKTDGKEYSYEIYNSKEVSRRYSEIKIKNRGRCCGGHCFCVLCGTGRHLFDKSYDTGCRVRRCRVSTNWHGFGCQLQGASTSARNDYGYDTHYDSIYYCVMLDEAANGYDRYEYSNEDIIAVKEYVGTRYYVLFSDDIADAHLVGVNAFWIDNIILIVFLCGIVVAIWQRKRLVKLFCKLDDFVEG